MTIVSRCIISFLLLSITFNPTPYNYIQWAHDMWREQTSLVALATTILLIGYIIFLRATFRSIGALEIGLILLLSSSILWVLVDFSILSLKNPTHNTWIAIIVLSLVLGIGLSWSIIRQKISGQADVNDSLD